MERSAPPPQGPAPDPVREMWATASVGWEEHAGYVDERGAAVTAAMLRRTAPRPGDRVLELACGPGGVGLAAAERVGPTGTVVLSDLVEEMTRIAATRAAAAGLDNVEVRLLDLAGLDEPDGAFDVVVCREGLMLAPDPAVAVAEMRRVLRSGGRLAVAVWGPRARNPWLGALFDAVTAVTGLPVPPPGLPGPFALADADGLSSLLTGAGLDDVGVEEVAEPFHVASFDDWWRTVPALAGPLAAVIASLPPDLTDAIRAHAADALEAHSGPDGVHLPGVSLVAAARVA